MAAGTIALFAFALVLPSGRPGVGRAALYHGGRLITACDQQDDPASREQWPPPSPSPSPSPSPPPALSAGDLVTALPIALGLVSITVFILSSLGIFDDVDVLKGFSLPPEWQEWLQE